MKIKIIIAACIVLCGCEPREVPRAEVFARYETKTDINGFAYKIVHIEGRKYIATYSAHKSWNLTGPIDGPRVP